MTTKRTSSAAATTGSTTPIPRDPNGGGDGSFASWIAGAIDQGVKPEQALAVVGLGLMRGMGGAAIGLPVAQADGFDLESPVQLQSLKGRLEAIALAISTGAPLSTHEVGLLLGARPGAPRVRRAGVVAERIGRNVWQLRRSSDDERSSNAGFSEGFRRRL
ncbi:MULTISPECIES: hypothetical protein [Synechococcales]|uniref:hypothetical protein n=1 Tax=Synechococcus sp. CS-1333 TaxID=2848638 RepID=UPI00223B5F36|nr:hypothetical protein [Synechococcus sp. CS-1333]